MKIFNIIKKTILALSFILCAVSFIIGSITLNQNDVLFSSGLVAYIVIGIAGFFLFCAKNEIARKIGMGISTGIMLVQLYFAITLIATGSVGAIIGLVSTVLYAIYFLTSFIGNLAVGENADNDPEADPRIKKVLGWKKLQDEGIISPEEFEEKRQEILGLKSKNAKK